MEAVFGKFVYSYSQDFGLRARSIAAPEFHILTFAVGFMDRFFGHLRSSQLFDLGKLVVYRLM
jgi:hypothetical protein